MAVLEIPSISKEYVKIPITTGPPDLTDLDVNLAILPQGETPDTGDWTAGVWVGTAAAVLIGPGTDYELTAGITYGIWVQIIDDPEEPVLGPYPLHIT